jgi:alcohol dehydrogenase
MLSFNFRLPTTLLFGSGRLAELETTPLLPAGKKALIVIGQSGNILRQGYLGRVQGLLAARGVKSMVFDGVQANPLAEDIDKAAEQARSMGADMVVGIGGGSVIDSAKAIGLAAGSAGPFWQTWHAQGYENKAGLPIIAIPTTAGTGTEANGVAMVVGEPGKRGFMHQAMFPALSIVDPELSASMPARLTAHTGMDAFFHAVECFLSKARQPMSDMLCLEAAHLVTRFLPQAVEQGDDMNARTALAWASTAAGMALALSSPISLHALEYSFSGSGAGSAHGAGLIVLSRAYFGRLVELAGDDEETTDRLLNLAVAMGFGADEDEDLHPFLMALDALLEATGMDELSPADLGYGPEEIDRCVAMAMDLKDYRHFQNTPVVMGEDDVRAIFEDAFERR